jgi:uncharacterized OB-fold protein
MKINLTSTSAVASKTEERKYVPTGRVVEVTVTKATPMKSKKGNEYVILEVEDADGGTSDGLMVNLSGRTELEVGGKINVVCTLSCIKGKWDRKIIV